MKRSIGIILIAIVFFSMACNKEEAPVLPETVAYDYNATIIGLDLTLCACCGGYIAHIKDSISQFRIQKFPEDFQASLDTLEFPIDVQMNYTALDYCSTFGFINVDAIELVD